MPKKLIEVALPLEAINQESAREKSIRHGHPSTLHLWWARRPLAAARAVIWSSLVDDPSAHPERFPTEEEQNAERQRLFGILEQLVKWENSNDPAILEKAKAEIMKSTDNNPPALLDPFAGGGAIPVEAQRLGLASYAHDLNPVAVTINKAMIEIPSKFSGKAPVNPDAQGDVFRSNGWKRAAGLATDLLYYGRWMKERAFERIGNMYPKVKDEKGHELTVIAWIWARTVASPDPLAKGKSVPLVSSLMLSTKSNNKAWVDIVEDKDSISGWKFIVKSGSISKSEEEKKLLGTKAGKAKDFICCLTNSPIPRSYIQKMGKEGKLSKRLMAIVALGPNGRVYLSPNEEHEKAAEVIKYKAEIADARDSFLSGSTPTRAMITGGVCSAYGFDTWGKLFSDRQLASLLTFSELIGEARSRIINDGGDEDYANALSVYLAFAVDKLIDINSSACSWISANGVIRNTFARQAIPMVWDFAEANPFSSSTGCFDLILGKVCECIEELPGQGVGIANQVDAQTDVGLKSMMISTDPPYYDNIAYAILSDFFYVWMRKALGSIYPDLFNTMLTPKTEELVASPYRFDGGIDEARAFFEQGMLEVFKRIFEYSREDIPVTVYYAYKQSENEGDQTSSSGWETMLSAIIQAGFSITGTWPMRTEKPGRMIGNGANALASSIVLVCRKRSADAPVCTRRELVTALKRELRPALQKLQASNIAPVDLAQSAIGPGMGVFSRYKQVLEADGSVMTVRSALQIINQELDRYFNDQDDALDSDSRLCVDLFTQYAFNSLKFGDADILARAKNTSVAKLAEKGVLYAAKGEVHLLTRDEIPAKVNPGESNVWMLTQQLTRAMEREGIEGCAKIANDILGVVIEHAKDLAYRLYTICERKGWAQEGYAYNALVVAWPEIQSRAAQLRMAEPVQMDLFSGEVYSGEV